MTDTTPRPDASLLEVLGARARRSSDNRLTADAVGGLVVAIAASLWRGPAWYAVLGAAICFFAFGVWGIVDRELSEQQNASRPLVVTLRAIRVCSTVLGIAAAVFLMMVVLARALGRIIS